MSYNGSGTFNINSAGQPVVTGTVISSTSFNALTADLATGLTTALTKDGQTTPTANIKLGTYKLTGVGAGTTANDALVWGQTASININGTVGATTPTTGAFTTVAASSTVTGSALIPSSATVPTNGVYLPASNTLGIATNSSEQARFIGNKRFLLGATTQSGTGLTLSGNDGVDNFWASQITTTSSYNLFSFANGNGGIGTINLSGSTTSYNTSSDYRLKENIQPIKNALALVAQLNPVTFNWKVDGAEGQGFIAHELQAVVPDCVTGEKDAVDADGKPVHQSIDTSFLVATLTAAIKELTAKIAVLEAKQ